MRILGIDPGTRLTGYGCIDPAKGRAGREVLVEAGVLRLDGRRPLSERLLELAADLDGLLERLRPQAVAVEAVFSHVKFPATAIVMGHARGVILLSVMRAGVGLMEVRPAEVKRAIAASGRAGKEQVQRAVQAEFGLAQLPKPPDVADALAIALCAARRSERRG